MLEEIHLHILEILQNHDYITSEHIAVQLGYSTKTIRVKVKEINTALKNKGANIVIKKGSGYLLSIDDQTTFYNYLTSSKKNFNTAKDDEIVTQLIQIFITNKCYVKADTLIDQLFISKSSLTKYIKEMKFFLKQYDLDMEVKPHYGLRIKGSEFNYRRFIASKYAQFSTFNNGHFLNLSNSNADYKVLRKEISIILKEEMERYKYDIRQTIFDSLVLHLLITVKRIQQGVAIDNDLELFNYMEAMKSKNLVDSIINRVSNVTDIQFPKKEYAYVLMHFESKRILKQEEADNIPQEVNALINEILLTIYKEQNIDYMHNFDLRTMLGLHLVPLLYRLQFGTVLRNPILKEVKKACVVGYDSAIVASKVIEAKMQVPIEDDEISYLALHFDVALNTKDKIYKKRILIVCSTGRASAQLLKYKFKQYFQQYLKTIDVCDTQELEKYINVTKYDYIFTTVPIDIKTKIPVFEFQFFLNDTSVKKIESILTGTIQQKNHITSVFNENLFFSNIDFKNKTDALNYVLAEVRKRKTLPDDFEALVWERENYSSTDLLPHVSLPHPNRLSTNETFIATMILNRPMLWDSQKVSIVLLLSISKKDSEKYKYIFDWIIHLFASNSAVQRIIKDKSYASLERELLLINDREVK